MQTGEIKQEVRDLTVPLRGGAMAVLSLPLPLSKAHYASLKKWLEWAEDEITVAEEGHDAQEDRDGA